VSGSPTSRFSSETASLSVDCACYTH
jgi:hypothetical protein